VRALRTGTTLRRCADLVHQPPMNVLGTTGCVASTLLHLAAVSP
jgi:hypothetical protein